MVKKANTKTEARAVKGFLGWKQKVHASALVVCMFLFIACTGNAFAEDGNDNEGTVTKAEWLHSLITTFELTVEQSSMPDMYFTDVEQGDASYSDILIAEYYGLVDAEEGTDFHPNDSATREFAAQTLNMQLGFQIDPNAEYTFTDSTDCKYPDADQVAVNREWSELAGSQFQPEKAITQEEKEAMLADAQAVLEERTIDENHENEYVLTEDAAESIVEIPEGTVVEKTDRNKVTITDNPKELAAGDEFIVYHMMRSWNS